MAITNYRQLEVWAKRMDLAEAIYAAARETAAALLESIDPIGRMLNRLHARLTETTSP